MQTESERRSASEHKTLLDTIAREDLLQYAQEISPSFRLAPHLYKIAEKLEGMLRGTCRRLIVNMPPRHGKSELITRIFPTWFLGHKPASQIIVASYASSLAKDFTRWQRNRAESERYRDLFPAVKLRDDSRAVERWETSMGGVVVGAGVGGPLTGRGADLAVIDDPVKNYEEAVSPVMQDMVWDWYQSTLRTRLHPGGSIVIVMTRWVKNDLTGRLLERESEKWEVLKIPALDENGEAMWPERYSKDDIADIRSSVTEKIFAALYQQEPVDMVERTFEDPQYYDKLPDEKLKVVAYLDPAFGGLDSSALCIGGKSDGIFYILGAWLWQSEIDGTYDRVEEYCKRYHVRTLYFEQTQAQRILTYEFGRRGIPNKGRDKIHEKHAWIIDRTKRHWKNIRFPHSLQPAWKKQLLDYTELAPHDDAADSLAGLLNELTGGGTGSILISGRRDFAGGPF